MFYDFVSWAVRLILAVFTRCTIENLDRVPRDGAFMVVCNHLNLVDPPILGSLLRRRVVFMAKEELFGVPVVGWVVRWYGAFSVKRGQADRQALRRATEVLERGGVLGIFPEGHRSETGKMIQAHPGAALIAITAGATVLPVAILGTDRLRSPLSFLHRPRITVRVGEPFVLERSQSRRGGLADATAEMMGRVAALLPPERRGVYGDAAGNEGRDLIARTRGLQ